jgi:hypothetical protein
MKPLRVEFDMTREDLTTAADVVADLDAGVRMVRRRSQRIFAGLIALLVTLQAAALALAGPLVDPASVAFTGAMVLWLVWLCPTRRSLRRAVRKQTAARFTTAAGRAYLGPRSVEVGRDGLSISSEYGSSLTTWCGVIDVIHTPTHMFVVLPGPSYLCVPRRAFDSDDDFERFGASVTELAAAGGGLTGRSPPPQSTHHPV